MNVMFNILDQLGQSLNCNFVKHCCIVPIPAEVVLRDLFSYEMNENFVGTNTAHITIAI